MNIKNKGILVALVSGICWGFSGTCSQYLMSAQGVESGWLACVRMLGAGIILILYSVLKNQSRAFGIFKVRRDVLAMMLFGIIGIMASQYTYLEAIHLTNAGTATVLQYLAPVLIMIYLCVREGRFPKKIEIFAVAMAMGGTFLLATHGKPGSLSISTRGFIIGISSAFTLMVYNLSPQKIVARWGSITVSGFGMLIGGMVLALVLKFWEIDISLDALGVLALFVVVIVGTVIAYTMFLTAINMIGAWRASLVASVEPMSAVAFSAILLGTKFIWADFMGFALIIATVIMLSKKE